MEFLIRRALVTMPKYVAYTIEKRLYEIKMGEKYIEEVRIVRGAGSSVFVRGRCYKLYINITKKEMEQTLLRLCDGALYRHKETIKRGYISLGDGIRVGVCGGAKYDGDKLLFVDDISMLVYRFPMRESSLDGELYSAYSLARRGMLIYSIAGGGKTTAIRTLAKTIAKREKDVKIAVVDEREEFNSYECENLGIALLRGYRRNHGVDIALRTLGAGVIVVDEIGCEDESYSIRQFLLSGAKFIATAHAPCLEELLRRDCILPYLERRVFDVFFGIFNTDGNYYCKVDKNNV